MTGSPPTPAVLQTLADLIRINSVNPSYPSGVPESGVIDYIEAFFQHRSIKTWRQSVQPQRDNLIASISGRDRDRRHCWISTFRPPLGKWIIHLQMVIPFSSCLLNAY